MTQIREHYGRNADVFEGKVLSVPSDAWDQLSPCPQWSARDVVQHIADSSGMFLGWVDLSIPEGPSAADDPAQLWRNTRSAVETALEDEDAATTVLERTMATQTFADFVDQYLAFDLVVHAWDLARAAGVDDELSPQVLPDALKRARETAELGRTMGAFGPEVIVDESADDQTKLLALVGRTR